LRCDEEASGGAAGEQEGAGDGKSAADVLIVGEEKAQHHNEDGKRASEGVNDVPAVTQAKTTTLSTEQQSFVLKFMPAAATIDKKRKITTRHVKGRINSLKKQGARVADVKGTALTKRPQEFPGHFLSVVSGQVYCGACHTNIGSAKTAVRQHTEGKEHIQKVHSKVAGSDRGTKILECITAYKVMVKDSQVCHLSSSCLSWCRLWRRTGVQLMPHSFVNVTESVCHQQLKFCVL
jgi:hypothetical protein